MTQVTRKRLELGMYMFLIAEAVFFFLLILAFRYLAATPSLSSRNGWILTALLAAGSVSIWRRWRWATVALGAAFVIAVVVLGAPLLVMIHALHILAGLIAVAIIPASAFRVMALYWHFFTAVWIAIFLIVYSGGVA